MNFGSGCFAAVTGAGSGVARQSAFALLGDGCRVALLGRRRSALEETAGVARTADQCLVIPADVTDKRAVKTTFGLVLERFGRLDVMFKNAGGKMQPVPIDDLTLEQWQSVIDVNLTGNSYGRAMRLTPQVYAILGQRFGPQS